MRALLHLDPRTQQLLGVWVWADGRPQSFYRAHRSDELAGQDAMAKHLGGSWDEWVDRLVGRSPARIWWEAVDVQRGEDARAVYERVLAQE